MLPDMRVNKFFTISGKAEHLQAASWACCCMQMRRCMHSAAYVKLSLLHLGFCSIIHWTLCAICMSQQLLVHNIGMSQLILILDINILLCSALKRKASRMQTHCTLIGCVYVTHINGRPEPPEKLLVIVATLLHSHQHPDRPQDSVQGTAKSCHNCTHPWGKAHMGLGSDLDCCGRQLAIP